MDDPFGPALLMILFFLLAAIQRIVAAATPFIDDGEMHRQAESGSKRAQRTMRLIKRVDTEAFGEVQMAYVWLLLGACAVACAWLSNGFQAMLIAQFPALTKQVTLLLSSIGILIPFALLASILTGVVPGYLAAHAPQKWFDGVALIAEWTLFLIYPLTALSILLGRAILAPFHIKPANANDHVTEEEIMMMVDIGKEKGAIEADEKEMIENIFEFNNMDAEDCMIHRKDIVAIDIDDTDEEILETIRESGLSRFPVYEDSIDNVLGILATRDYLYNKCIGTNVTLRDLIRPAHFVPESVHTDILFREMQTRKQHMAIIVDEYGGTSGLITLEDLLEEIVGNIYDEFDPKEVQEITSLPDGKYRISGSAELETIAEVLDIDLPDDDEYDTLGGLIFSQMTEIPADGQHPTVECFGLRISVEKIAERRVEWAIVEKLDSDTKENERK